MTWFRIVSVCLLLAVLVSCSGNKPNIQYGDMVTETKVKKLQKNKTTSVEAVQLLGKPQNITTLDNGFVYFYKDYNLDAVWLRFDSNGILVEQKGP